MENLTFTPFTRKDIPALIEVLSKVWPLDAYTDEARVRKRFSILDAYYCAMFADDSEAVYDGDRLVGVLLGRTRRVGNPFKYLFYGLLTQYHVVMLLLRRHSRQIFYEILKIDKAYRAMKKEASLKAMSEVVLFAVDPDYQGHGIGRALMDRFFARLKSARVYLFSDTDCNYGFYEAYGFTRESEKALDVNTSDGTKEVRAFLYVHTPDKTAKTR